jgi:hypothetical protein
MSDGNWCAREKIRLLRAKGISGAGMSVVIISRQGRPCKYGEI